MAYRWGERIDVVGLASSGAGWQWQESGRGNEVLSSFVSFAMQCTRGGNTAATSTASRPAIRSPLVVVAALRMRSDTWQGRTITFTLPTHKLTSSQLSCRWYFVFRSGKLLFFFFYLVVASSSTSSHWQYEISFIVLRVSLCTYVTTGSIVVIRNE